MKTSLIKFDVTKLKKQQLEGYVSQTVELVDMQNAQTLHLDVETDKLKALIPEFERLASKYVSSYPETAQFKIINSDINNVLRSITLQVKAAERMQYVVKADDLEMVKEFVASYIKPAIPELIEPTVAICSGMLKELNANVALRTVAERIGLKVHFVEIQRLVDLEAALRSSLLEKTTQRKKSITVTLRNQVAKAIINLQKAIEVEREKFPEVDYEPLVSGLNALNARHRMVQKARLTRSKTDSLAQNEATVASSSKTTATVA